MSIKTPSQSRTELCCLATPADANTIGTIFGGRLMELMDMTAAICARRHSNRRVATLKVETMCFHAPLHVGNVINVSAVMNRAFRSSMDISVSVIGEDTCKNQRFLAASAIFIVVGLDETNKPVKVAELDLETDQDRERWNEAGQRHKQKVKED